MNSIEPSDLAHIRSVLLQTFGTSSLTSQRYSPLLAVGVGDAFLFLELTTVMHRILIVIVLLELQKKKDITQYAPEAVSQEEQGRLPEM